VISHHFPKYYECMMIRMTDCFICKKGLTLFIGGFTLENLQDRKITRPEGFTDKDRICPECMKDLEKGRGLEEIKDQKQEPTQWIWTIPIFLGLLGGILAYIALKDHDQNRANDMIIYGILSSIASIVLLFAAYSIILNNSLL